MAARSVRGFRVRLWTGDDGPNGKNYATEIVKRALAGGLEPYLVIFLSEDWADLMKQPAPTIWKDLDLPKRAEAVRAYSRDIVTHFRKVGLRSHLYEIGNEIDYGICGVYPGKSTRKNAEGLSRTCWPQAAELIRASQQGVLEADPDAKFLLHISHWWDADFCIAFFRFMLAHDVRVDYAGLSYFPSSNIGGSLEMSQFGAVVRALHAAIDRPIIVPESGYPSTADFKGQFSRWKKATPGYPLTPEGQQRWLKDFLDYCAHEPAIASVYSWSPEWCGAGMWEAFALFDADGAARPAWAAFAKSRAERPAPKNWRYFEARGDRLYPVPIEEARKRAEPILEKELAAAGRVNTDYINAISARELLVGGYRVNLRATLSGNLDLDLQESASAPPWKEQLASLDSTKERVVIFAREPDSAFVAEVLAAAGDRGIEAVVHRIDPDQPLKFGQTAGVPPTSVGSP
jgi:arabinogalactan endo-1,4-beta-galactosidase